MPCPVKVLFVCLHGAAKSVIAARHLERLTAGEAFSVEASSAGIEPDPGIPPHVVAGLASDTIDISRAGAPVQVTSPLVGAADLVVSFGCDLAAVSQGGRVITWDDVPAVSDGYAEARDAIVTHLQGLLDEIRSLGMSSAAR